MIVPTHIVRSRNEPDVTIRHERDIDEGGRTMGKGCMGMHMAPVDFGVFSPSLSLSYYSTGHLLYFSSLLIDLSILSWHLIMTSLQIQSPI